MAGHHAAVVQVQPDRLGLGNQIADRQHHAILADQDGVARALGAERLRREGIARNDRVQAHHRGKGLIEIIAVVLRLRLHRRRHLVIGQCWHFAESLTVSGPPNIG